MVVFSSTSVRSRSVAASALALACVAMGCGGNSNGEVCVSDLDCQSTFVCVADPLIDEARCMRPCDDATRLCADGSVCVDLAGGRACYPGGSIGFGEPCTTSLECEAGTVCPDAIRECTQACNGTSPVCVVTERCVDDATVGAYCSP